MKKLLSLALALIMVLSLSVAVFADENFTPPATSTATINVTYTVINKDTTSPAEDLKFTCEKTRFQDTAAGVQLADMPEISIADVHIDAVTATQNMTTATAAVTINIPEADQFPGVGVYTYTIHPQAGKNAGVTYYTKDIRLVITVIEVENGQRRIAAIHTESGEPEDDNKSDDIEYTYSAGELKVTKNVEGNLGDKNKYFAITVTLTGEDGKTYAANYPVSGGSKLGNGTDALTATTISVGKTATFWLKDGETFTISNLPYNVSYKVKETDASAEGYTVSYSPNQNGTISKATDTVTITNTKNSPVDTGIVLDSLPYVLLIAVAVVGVVIFTARKRSHREY